ncbi:conserved hypothetical protein [Acinetobacter proteolyticus]|uniref:Uncharacterized protein n=1 Tax=Acinetobacter proteolyticus TaxID=1776741 RepID=A0A653K0R0_9GAMM|nr:virulence factor TspB C-terminal domain-related protein [Acinetobacter proteolyticus]VXA54277.1 conserved hypothetical protein [Acinetobacter proteolyticus]
MRFFKYLVFIFFSLFSFNLYADYYAIYNNIKYVASSPDAVCKSVESAYSRQDRLPLKYRAITNATNVGYCYDTFNNSFNVFKGQSCPVAGTVDLKSVPHRLLKLQVCIENCLWNPDPDAKGEVCGENSGICATDFKSAGTSCSQNSDLNPNQQDIDNTAPPEPEQPQECKNSSGSDAYCPKPPKGCPSGYSEQSFNGEAICVKDSPQNPNPIDPNNNENQPPASEPNGGGEGGGIDSAGIINAINSMKTAIVSAINSVSSKLDSMFTEQKKGNQYLDDIKKESIKTNEKLDTTNNHLKQIEGTGKEVKDFLTDKKGSEIPGVGTPIEGISVGELDYNIFKVNAQCPASPTLVVSLSHTTKSFGIDYSQLCDILRYMGYLISLVALLHAGSILVRDS